MKTLRDFNFNKKRVLVRCDFNIPIDEKGDILDDFRIEQATPTINFLRQKGARVILMSHLDDPPDEVVESLRLNKIQKRLSDLLGLPVKKTDDCMGKKVEVQALEMKEGEILLLENLRFHREEREGDINFAKELSNLGEIYINEAFSACHRSHASISGVPKFLPHGAGFLLEKEIDYLDRLLKEYKKPLVAIVGGKKVETKAKFINKISEIADTVIISGLIEKEIKEKKIQIKNLQKIVAPIDSVGQGLDIGPKSINLFREKIIAAETVVWNGPFGKIEDDKFSKGTTEIVKAIIESKVFSVAGGGETVEFIRKLNLFDKFSHISTGGGAMLSYLAGDKLPGIEALK